MIKKIALPLIGLGLFACAGAPTPKPSPPGPSAEAATPPMCFRLISENNFEEFKKHGEECLTFRGATGLTSLMLAVAKDKNDIAEYLMEEGADVNQPDEAGFTPLSFAANRNNARLAQLLRRRGARIEALKDNLTPLMLAVSNASFETVRVLNPTPTEVNIRAEDGWTAIYFAIRRESAEMLRFLLERGACTRQKDSYQQTPEEFAREVKWSEGIKLLKRSTKC